MHEHCLNTSLGWGYRSSRGFHGACEAAKRAQLDFVALVEPLAIYMFTLQGLQICILHSSFNCNDHGIRAVDIRGMG